jgi:hypothetical protein
MKGSLRLLLLIALALVSEQASASFLCRWFGGVAATPNRDVAPVLDETFQHYQQYDESDHPNYIGADFQKAPMPSGVVLPKGFSFSAHYKWRSGSYSETWRHQISVSRDGKEVGFIRFSNYPEFLILNVREVVPKYQDQKLGKGLIDAMFEVVGDKPARIDSLMAHTNYRAFTKGLAEGLTPEQAVAATPTGKTLLASGYVVQTVVADPKTLKKFPASFEGRDNRYLVGSSQHDYQSFLEEPYIRFVR